MRPHHIAALVLAAGRSTRMGGSNKLLAPWHGEALVRHPIRAAVAAGLEPVVVVTGHQREEVAQAVDGLGALCVDNPDYRAGLSTSLRRGLAALPGDCDGVLVLLGDMPAVGAATLAVLVAGFAPEAGVSIVVPNHAGRRGNPVLWHRDHFAEMATLGGDHGARELIERHAKSVRCVPVGDPAVLRDVDTPDDLASLEREARPG